MVDVLVQVRFTYILLYRYRKIETILAHLLQLNNHLLSVLTERCPVCNCNINIKLSVFMGPWWFELKPYLSILKTRKLKDLLTDQLFKKR